MAEVGETKPAIEKVTEREITKEGDTYLDLCESFKIDTAQDYQQAGFERVRGKGHRKRIDDFMDPHIQAAHNNHKSLVASKKELAGPVTAGIKLLGDKMEVWDAEERKKAKDEEARLRKLAEEQAQKEKAKELREEAKILKKEGDTAGAEALRDEAKNPVVEPVLVSTESITPPKVEGTHYRETWVVEVYNAKIVPDDYKLVDLAAVKKVVVATQGKVIPKGIKAYKQRKAV